MDAALRFYCDRLGPDAGPIEERADYGIRICRVHVGAMYLELIEARDWNTTMQRFLPHQGPGVYHVGLRVDDVDACVGELERDHVELLDPEPREGDDMACLLPGTVGRGRRAGRAGHPEAAISNTEISRGAKIRTRCAVQPRPRLT